MKPTPENTAPEEPGKNAPEPDLKSQFDDLLKGLQVRFMGAPEAAAGGREGAPPGHEAEARERRHREALDRIRTFSLRPREIRDYLDRFVIRQEQAKKALSVALCDHYNHVRRCLEDPRAADRYYAKQNLLLMGPTGVGKTYLVRTIARLIGVPFVKADATKFSETGYVGYDVEDLVRDLVKLSGGDLELAQYGIIYIDEIDKIAARQTAGRDVSGRGVQVNLLKLMEETEANLFSQTDLIGQMQAVMDLQRGQAPERTINTRHMLFIVSGAFDHLADVVRRRVDRSAIGFDPAQGAAQKTEEHYLRQACAADFIEYGFEPEFIGRLPVRVACDPLDIQDLVDVLVKSEDSLLRQYREDFEGYALDLTIEDEAIHAVARLAQAEKTGARGLMTVLERALREFKYLLPSTAIRSFTLTADAVKDPARAAQAIEKESALQREVLLRRDAEAFAERFRSQYGLALRFEPAAIEALVNLAMARSRTMRGLCEELFKDYVYGLKLAAQTAGGTEFVVTERAVADPDGELSRWIKEHYRPPEPAGTAAARPPPSEGQE